MSFEKQQSRTRALVRTAVDRFVVDMDDAIEEFDNAGDRQGVADAKALINAVKSAAAIRFSERSSS